MNAAVGGFDPLSLDAETFTARRTKAPRQHKAPHRASDRLLEEEDAEPTLDAGTGGGSALDKAVGGLDPLSLDAEAFTGGRGPGRRRGQHRTARARRGRGRRSGCPRSVVGRRAAGEQRRGGEGRSGEGGAEWVP